jgi:hypothetical protein
MIFVQGNPFQPFKPIDRPDSQSNSHQRSAFLRRSLAALQSSCIHSDKLDWIRRLVCTISRLTPDEITLNARYLKTFFGKSKSSINDALSLTNYVNIRLQMDQITRISSAIPYLAAHNTELRQWTIRQLIPSTKKFGVLELAQEEDSLRLVSDDLPRTNEMSCFADAAIFRDCESLRQDQVWELRVHLNFLLSIH